MHIRYFAASLLSLTLLSVALPAHAAHPLRTPDAELCPVTQQEYIVDEFPYEMPLKDSFEYEEGPRSCSYWEKREITYWCDSPDEEEYTVLNVIANGPNSTRNVFRVYCDGQVHTGGAEMYPDQSGPYHLHWHLHHGDWNKAYMSVGERTA